MLLRGLLMTALLIGLSTTAMANPAPDEISGFSSLHWYDEVPMTKKEMINTYLMMEAQERAKLIEDMELLGYDAETRQQRLNQFDQMSEENLARLNRLGTDIPEEYEECGYTADYMFKFTRRLVEPNTWDGPPTKNAILVLLAPSIVLGEILGLPLAAAMGFTHLDCAAD